jgi:hypothetical protein
LFEAREMGELDRRNQEDEIYRLEMKVYKKKFLLHRRGEHAKKYISFWEYVQVVNTELHTSSSSSKDKAAPVNMTLAEHKTSLAVEQEEQRTKSTAVVSLAQSIALSFNIFSFFEAFLLRRLHIAMILKHQRAAQSTAWNGVIMFLYNKTPGIKKQLKNVKTKYSTLKPESNETIKGMRKLRKKKLGLLERMILILEDEAPSSEEEEDYALSNDDRALIKEAVPNKVGGDDDDDDDKGLDTASMHSFSSRQSRVKRRGSNASEVSAPHWMRSSRNKMSQSIHRDISHKKMDDAIETKVDDPLMPSSADGDNSADDEIEKFLYPNGLKTKPRNSRRRTTSGSKLISNMKMNFDIGEDTIPAVPKPSGLPSELVISSQTIVSHLHDDASSIDSSSFRTPASRTSDQPRKNKSMDDIRRRKRELEDLRMTISRSFDGKGETGAMGGRNSCEF